MWRVRFDRSNSSGRTGQTRPVDQVRLAQYNTTEARTLFAQLLRRVRRGEHVVIAHAGQPVAKLVPFDGGAPRRSGVIRAHLVVHDATPERDVD